MKSTTLLASILFILGLVCLSNGCKSRSAENLPVEESVSTEVKKSNERNYRPIMTSMEVTKDSGHQTDFYIKSENESRHLEMNKDKSNMEKNSQFGKESISEKEPKTEDNNEKKVTQDHLERKQNKLQL
ncbi:uncharacterized protein LOC124452762 [Xenia sp. Carnegie-2017]|uniref:uncharacterized protein LOC124452762 n=1 Tax=Xenia sp. Carnegie-2017 TaxID=2897299 RepID=UPI001F045B0C|nr:uncharacterized protein LOC124452762 [Xenia sp. Carnegie-2017]